MLQDVGKDMTADFDVTLGIEDNLAPVDRRVRICAPA